MSSVLVSHSVHKFSFSIGRLPLKTDVYKQEHPAASCAVLQPSLLHLPGGYLHFKPLPVQSFHLETVFAFGLYLHSAKSIPGSFLQLGMVFCLQHYQARKSYVISLGRENSQVLIRQQPWQSCWFKAFQAQVWDISKLFLMLSIFFCIDCVLVTGPFSTQSLTTDWVVIIDIYVPGINEQMWEKEVKHFLLEL